jgi:hypothetical protein
MKLSGSGLNTLPSSALIIDSSAIVSLYMSGMPSFWNFSFLSSEPMMLITVLA